MMSAEKNGIREDMPITKRLIYMDNAATSPIRNSTIKEIDQWYEDVALNGDLNYEIYLKKIEECRINVAKLMNAEPDEIAFLKNTTEGLNLASIIMQKRSKKEKRNNIITTDMEFPSNLLPWLNIQRGDPQIKIDIIKSRDYRIDLNDIEKAVDEKTLCVAISHVEFSNGFRNDLKEIKKICDEKGAKLVVDCVHSLGALKFEPYADIACGAGYKWLMGPYGVGIFYISKRFLEEIKGLPVIGHNSIKYDETKRFDYKNVEMKKGARIFEIGNMPFPLIFALSESIKTFLEIGVENIEREILKFSEELINGLKLGVKTPMENRSSIVGAFCKKDLIPELRKKKIIISKRSDILRFSPHFWNTEEEIKKVIDEVNRIADN